MREPGDGKGYENRAAKNFSLPARYGIMPALFNRTDVLPPGEAREFAVLIDFGPARPEDLYAAGIRLDYSAVGDMRCRISYSPPCHDASGREDDAGGSGYCDLYLISRHERGFMRLR